MSDREQCEEIFQSNINQNSQTEGLAKHSTLQYYIYKSTELHTLE